MHFFTPFQCLGSITSFLERYYAFLKKNILFLACLFYLPFLYNNCKSLYGVWPGYIWETLFISYAGGFVRRGLVGEVLYYLQMHGIEIRFYLILCVAIFSILFLVFCFSFLNKNLDIVSALFISLSPGIFIFGFIEFGDFARSDWLIATLFIIMLYVAQNDTFFSRILICLLACFGILIHEALFFYLPMPFMLLYASRTRENSLYDFFLFAIIFFCSILVLIFLFSGNVEQREMMEMEWRKLIPDFRAKGLMAYIGMSLKEVNPWFTWGYFQLKSVMGIVLCLIFTTAPIAWWALKNKIILKLCMAFPRWWERCMLLGSIMSPLLLMLIEYDFGRRISLFAIEFLFFLIFFCKMKRLEIYRNRTITFPAFVLLLVTSFTWKMYHYTPAGESIFLFTPYLLIKFMLLSFVAFLCFILIHCLLKRFDKYFISSYIINILNYFER